MHLQFTLRSEAGKDFTDMFALIFTLLEAERKSIYADTISTGPNIQSTLDGLQHLKHTVEFSHQMLSDTRRVTLYTRQ